MGTWHNSDGLFLEFGVTKTTPNKAGEYKPRFDGTHEVELKITLADLTQSEVVQSDTTIFPAGARIQEVEIITQTAGATGTAIDLGLIKMDRSTELDYNGFLAAAPLGVMDLAGERTIYTAATTVPASATGTGALIGTTLAFDGLLTCSMTDATSFTAGVIKVKIRYYMP